MRLKSIMATLAVVGTLLTVSTVANAQTINLTATPVVATDATGTYHVDLTQGSPGVWTVHVTGNNDGNTGGPTPKHSLDQISFTFLGSTVTSNSGSVPPGSAWTTSIFSDTATFQAVGLATPVDPFGANTFTGTINLASAFNKGLIKVALQDGGQQWNVQTNLVPESASILLMLPALLPLLFFIRRRNVTAGFRAV
jgi:hypothetical protein